MYTLFTSEGEIRFQGLERRREHKPAFSRHVLPESCSISLTLSYRRGRGKAGRRLAPAIRGQEMHTGWITRQPDQPGPPARWFEQHLVLCPVSDALLPPSPCGLLGGIESPVESMRHHQAWRQLRRRQTARHWAAATAP